MFLVTIGLIIIFFLFAKLTKSIIKRCSLELSKDGIIGNRKKLFSNKFLKLPIEKIDSIAIKNGIKDKFFGGETITIRTSSGLICFMCVHNATEFVDKTLEAIKAYKESNKPVDANIPTNTSGDNLEQIKKLKEMLDNGIITQEEFDVKKKQLLGL
ncbi:MAG: SHOCT domain-containing protein [Ruminococcus sp.]|nr:SHOCT domain-containing protein [Ruminococcus sp.]